MWDIIAWELFFSTNGWTITKVELLYRRCVCVYACICVCFRAGGMPEHLFLIPTGKGELLCCHIRYLSFVRHSLEWQLLRTPSHMQFLSSWWMPPKQGLNSNAKLRGFRYFQLISCSSLTERKTTWNSPPVGQVVEPNLEPSTVPTGAKGLGYSHPWLVSWFPFALSHWACAQQPVQHLWSCQTLLCQSNSNPFGRGPLKWWTILSFPS